MLADAGNHAPPGGSVASVGLASGGILAWYKVQDFNLKDVSGLGVAHINRAAVKHARLWGRNWEANLQLGKIACLDHGLNMQSAA